MLLWPQFETVMSHPSKLSVFDFARDNHYKNYLYFVCTESPLINIERVGQRVQQGGHHVSEAKIIERYYKTLKNLRPAVEKSYRSFLWDNSETVPRLILEVFDGNEVTIHDENIPIWVNKYLINKQ